MISNGYTSDKSFPTAKLSAEVRSIFSHIKTYDFSNKLCTSRILSFLSFHMGRQSGKSDHIKKWSTITNFTAFVSFIHKISFLSAFSNLCLLRGSLARPVYIVPNCRWVAKRASCFQFPRWSLEDSERGRSTKLRNAVNCEKWSSLLMWSYFSDWRLIWKLRIRGFQWCIIYCYNRTQAAISVRIGCVLGAFVRCDLGS